MKNVKIIMIVSMILNFFIALSKLVCGVMFNFSSLIADSLQSLFDFITDVISMIASKVGDKRANKKHPFGYGMIENIANLFIGIILFLLALFILIRGFTSEKSIVKPIILFVLIGTLIMKSIVVYILYISGKKYKNNSLLMSSKESFLDMIATLIVLIVSMMLLFENNIEIFKYADIIGSIVISFIMFYTAFNMIKDNIDYLLGINEDNDDINSKIKDILSEIKLVKNNKIRLMKIGDYYTLYLTIDLDNSITLRRIINLENKLKKQIKKKIKEIRYIQIEFE